MTTPHPAGQGAGDRIELGCDLIREEVPLSRTDRQRVGAGHYREDHEFAQLHGEDVGEPIPLAQPRCCRCFEPWGTAGCATVRVLHRLAIEEREYRAEHERSRKLDQRCAEIASQGETYQHLESNSVRASISIDRYMIVEGGRRVIVECLMRLCREFEAVVPSLRREAVL